MPMRFPVWKGRSSDRQGSPSSGRSQARSSRPFPKGSPFRERSMDSPLHSFPGPFMKFFRW